MGYIVIQTDFGGGTSGSMTGMCMLVDPSLQVFDLTHQVPKFDVRKAGENLAEVIPLWPAGTVFVSVVDPGVGTSRRASVALLKNGSYVVSPDNGTLTLLLENPGIEAVRVIDETVNRLKGTEKVSIFHGRDLFAYCAGKLAAGLISFAEVGEEYSVSEIVKYEKLNYTCEPGKLKGHVADMMYTFGNLETNIPIEAAESAGMVPGDKLLVSIKNKDSFVLSHIIPYQPSFGWVPEGEEVIYNSSDGVLGIGINRGDFIRKYNIGFGRDWHIIITKEER